MPTTPLEQLVDHLQEIHDLRRARALLSWDQETYMPEKGGSARARQIGTLSQLAHEKFTSDRTKDLLEQVAATHDNDDPSSFPASLVRVVQRDYERDVRVPADLVARIARTSAEAKESWKRAREREDFATFAPHLATLVKLTREKADALGYDDERYDALLEEYEPGVTTRDVAEVFAPLRDELQTIVTALDEAPEPEAAFLDQTFATEEQRSFGIYLLREIGFDLTRGRQDQSAHPFTTMLSIDDVRITTRLAENDLTSGLFSTLHEAGHALYSQGLDSDLAGTPLGEGASLGMHESQARFWENIVGRSRAFWNRYYDELVDRFPEQLGDVPLDTFHRAVNRVSPSLIRVESDEVTYNLHIMLRFDIERDLISGDLAVEDIPDRWHAGMKEYLGITPDSPAQGALQDIHWSQAAFGYFSTYALGNLISAQLYDQVRSEMSAFDEHVRTGSFTPILEWLRTNIHRHGRKFTVPQLLRRVTGNEMRSAPWLRYIREKYGRLYGVALGSGGSPGQ